MGECTPLSCNDFNIRGLGMSPVPEEGLPEGVSCYKESRAILSVRMHLRSLRRSGPRGVKWCQHLPDGPQKVLLWGCNHVRSQAAAVRRAHVCGAYVAQHVVSPTANKPCRPQARRTGLRRACRPSASRAATAAALPQRPPGAAQWVLNWHLLRYLPL